MEIERYLPNAETVAAIENDVAIYNRRREHEAARLKTRRPAALTILVVAVLLVAYVIYLGAGTLHWLHGALLGGAALMWTQVDKWVGADAAWTRQGFRDHVLPVMFGFIKDFRYSHGITPRSFGAMPKELVPGHTHRTFDDVMSGTLEGGRFELFEMKLVQKSKNSETVMFEGAVLHCTLRTPFPGTLIATRKIGDFRRFFRDLFGRSALSEIVSGDRRLDELYEFRTDRRSDARRLLGGPLGGMLNQLWREWPGDTAQVGIRDRSVYVMLPSSRNFFELPSIETAISYSTDLVPMMRQIATFLSIAAMVHALDGTAAAQPEEAKDDESERDPEPDHPTEAAAPPAHDDDFVPLLDPIEPAEKPAGPKRPAARRRPRQPKGN